MIPFAQWIEDHTFTPSELEGYRLCPFQFYASSYLELDPSPEWGPELSPAERGILLHRILERLFTEDRSGIKAILKQELDRITRNRPNLIPALLRMQEGEILKTLEQFLEKEKPPSSQQPARREGLRPTCFEWSFGKKTPPLILEPPGNGPIPIGGRVDRIDIDRENKRFLVIDYKTGNRKITGSQIARGESLQLPLYILAVKELLLPDYEPIGGLYYHLSDLSCNTGILQADLLPERLPISARSSTLFPKDRWESLFRLVRGRVGEIVSQIKREQFTPSEEPCEPWCPWKDLCKIRRSAMDSGAEYCLPLMDRPTQV